MAVAPGARWVAWNDGDEGSPVHVWDPAAGREVHRLPAVEVLSGLAFSPDGKLVAISAEIDTRLWAVETGKEILRIARDDLENPLFSPDGRFLACADGRRVRLWETATGWPVATLLGHEDTVSHLAFSPDGRCLASGSWDTTIVVWDLTGHFRAGQQRTPKLTERQCAACWAELAGQDAAGAYRAVWDLAVAPAEAVPFLGQRLTPARPVPPALLDAWIAGLDDARFAVREKSMRELSRAGSVAEPALRRALGGKPSPEARRRIGPLLERLDRPVRSPDRLRELRSVAVLEYAGTTEARQLLRKLAAGAPGARLTRQAKAALERLAVRGRGGR